MSEELENNSLESQIENSLVKQNVTDAVINGLKEKYKDLKLRSLDDKEKYLELKDAAKEVGKVRILATKICKAGREDANKIQKLWVAKEKEVVGKIAEVENPLDSEIKAYDDEVNRKKEEIKRQQEQAYMERTQALTKMGALYTDNTFVLGDFSLEANLVKESSEEVWQDEIFPKFKEEFEKHEAERLAIEKQKAEHEAELKRQQEELAQKQREFEAQQAEFKKQQEEADKREKERADIENKKIQEAKDLKFRERLSSLTGWGFNGFTVSNHADIYGNKEDLLNLSDEDYSKLVESNNAYRIQRAKEQEEERLFQIKQAEEKAAQAERERIAEEQRQTEIKRQADEQRKAEELAKAGDKAIWEHFIAELSKITVPTVKSGQYRRIAISAKGKLDEILSLKAY